LSDLCPICQQPLTITSSAKSSCENADHRYHKLGFDFSTFKEMLIIGGYVIYYYPDKIMGHQVNGTNHFTINQPIKPDPHILSLIKNHKLLS